MYKPKELKSTYTEVNQKNKKFIEGYIYKNPT